MSRKNEMKKTDTDGGGLHNDFKMEDERLLLVLDLGIFSEK